MGRNRSFVGIGIPYELILLICFCTTCRLKLKTCSLYHEKLFIQKFNDMITQVLNEFFSASDIMEEVRGRFCYYTMDFRGSLKFLN